MLDKLIKSSIIAIGAILLVSMLLLLARDTSRIVNWSNSGFVHTSIRNVPDNLTAFHYVAPRDYISPTVPSINDTLLTIADSSATLQRWIEVIELPHEPGKEAEIIFLHDGDTLSTVIKSRPVLKSDFIAVIILFFLRMLIFSAFIILSLNAFFKRPDSPGVRALTLYSFSMAAFMGVAYMPMFAQVASFTIPYENFLRAFLIVLSSIFSSFWLMLNLVFPRKSRLLIHAPLLGYGICFAPQIISLAISMTPLLNTRAFGYGVYLIIITQIFAGLFILRHHYINSKTNLEKRQVKLVFWGSGASLVLFSIYVLDAFISRLHMLFEDIACSRSRRASGGAHNIWSSRERCW